MHFYSSPLVATVLKHYLHYIILHYYGILQLVLYSCRPNSLCTTSTHTYRHKVMIMCTCDDDETSKFTRLACHSE